MEGSVVPAPTDIENPYDNLLEILIETELVTLSPPCPSRCIYRVPDRFRGVCEEKYTPRVISIGPFHHGKEALKAMEDHKRWYLKCHMERTNSKLNDYIAKIKGREKQLRSCYAETIEHESDDFVKMILFDAIFLIEFLHRYYGPNLRDDNDCIFKKPLMKHEIVPDLLMLENQLPFFILEDLNDPDRNSVKGLSISFLRMQVELYFGVKLSDAYSGVEGEHFVDLLRKLLITPIGKESPPMTKTMKPAKAPSIEKLHLAGVKFKAITSTENLFGIRFEDGILKIPILEIGDGTELILRNLVALEQCNDDYCISNYVTIMDELVDTPTDAGLLVKYKIIHNDLGGGDLDLSNLINSLSTGLMYSSYSFYYGDLCGKLDEFHSSIWHRRIASLRRNYFKTPWQTISFVAAVVLLILTAIQAICSIISIF